MSKSGGESKLTRKIVVKAMIVASLVGLMVPALVVLMVFIALVAFSGFHAILRAVLMVVFGLAGLGLGTLAYMKVLPRITPKELRERGRR